MKTRAMVMLGLALLLAGASVFMARNWIQSQVQPVAAEQQTPQIQTTKMVVAASQMQYGNKIRREHLRVVDWPVGAVPQGAFSSIPELLGEQGEQERVVLRTIEVNEPILKNKVTGFGGRASLSTLISPGMRAMAIRVNDVNGVAGFVLPGDRVDILLTRDNPGDSTGLVTDVFLQNMKVLGIDQNANEDRSKPAVARAVTLEVTTQQAQKLTLAQKLGSLSLALRNVNTVDAETPVTVSARDLRVGEANLAPKPEIEAMTSADIVPQSEPAEPSTVAVETTGSTESGVDTKVVAKATKKEMPSVRIVRGLKATEYEVEKEKATFSAPSYSKPLNLLPSRLPPGATPKVQAKMAQPNTLSPLFAAPSVGMPSLRGPVLDKSDEKTAEETAVPAPESAITGPSLKVAPSSEPISLLKNGGRVGGDG